MMQLVVHCSPTVYACMLRQAVGQIQLEVHVNGSCLKYQVMKDGI